MAYFFFQTALSYPRHTRYSSSTRLLQWSSRMGQWTTTLWTFSPSLSLTFLPLPPHPKGGDVKREGRGGVGETQRTSVSLLCPRVTLALSLGTLDDSRYLCLYLREPAGSLVRPASLGRALGKQWAVVPRPQHPSCFACPPRTSWGSLPSTPHWLLGGPTCWPHHTSSPSQSRVALFYFLIFFN